MKKTALGYRPAPGGDTDLECTHVILTKEEYRQVLREKKQAEQDKRNTEYEAGKTVQRARDDALRRVRTAEEEARQSVEEMERELAAEREESAYQRGLNANLLRISRERANADRKLKPKKAHTGYVVVSSGEKERRYRDGNGRWQTVVLWETVLQGPYSVDFTEEQARKQMLEELFRADESGQCLIQQIGITGAYDGGYAAMLGDKEWREVHQEYNVMVERRLRANFRAGFWEMVLVHTKGLGVVPEDMRVK